MNQSTANTLRTIGIILTCIVVGISSLVLLLLALCGAILISANAHHNTQTTQQIYFVLAAAVVLIVIGVVVVSVLAKGMIRHPVPAASGGDAGALAAPPLPAGQSHAAPAALHLDPAHLSPASRTAMGQLMYAVGAYIGVIVLSGFASLLFPAMHALHPGFTSQVSSAGIAYCFLTAAPYAVLLYALAKHPGPRAFAYSLVAPTIALMGAVLTLPLLLFSLASSAHRGLGAFYFLFLVVQAGLNARIFYFGWMAIQKTGVHPAPKRLIIATLVMLFYDWMSGVMATGFAMSLLQQTRR